MISKSSLIQKIGSLLFFCITYTSATSQTINTLSATADAFVRNGSYASTNYGSDAALVVKTSSSTGYSRSTYLKFLLGSISEVSTAKLRVYGNNTDDNVISTISAFGVDSDSWEESAITWNNAPAASTTALNSVGVNAEVKFYEIDVTSFVKAQLSGDKVVSLLLKDIANQNKNVAFSSRQNASNPPQLIITSGSASEPPVPTEPTTDMTIAPLSDAYVRGGSSSSANFGSTTTLVIKGTSSSDFIRTSYLQFSVSAASAVGSAKLRIYGRNTENTTAVDVSAYGVADNWTEATINYSNAPSVIGAALTSVAVNDQAKYYELDVTAYVKGEFAGDKVVSFLLKDVGNKNRTIELNSKENAAFPPQLVISSGGTSEPPPVTEKSNSLLYIDNMDKFPSNDRVVFSRIQKPWSRDGITFNTNHDSVAIKLHNKGINPLIIKGLVFSQGTKYKIEKLKGVLYNPASFPISVAPGTSVELTVMFTAVDSDARVKFFRDTLTVLSNDDKFPSKPIYLAGIWQRQGEGDNEPYAQEIINIFGFKSKVGFSHTDADKGNTLKPKGDEIIPAYLVRANTSLPVSVRQISSYHGCCTQSEKIVWFAKGNTGTLTTITPHAARDAQTVLPRKSTANTPALGTFTPAGAFGFKIGSQDWSDPALNTGGKIGIRIWKAYDEKGFIIPNSYIISNDYLGSSFTNYDYNDNTYFVSNIRPEIGTAYFSSLSASPSAVDFGENMLGTPASLQLNLSSLGKTYANGSSDPALTITSVQVVGENYQEFTASNPGKSILNPSESTTCTITFNPASQGLKTADLIIYYNNSSIPVRVPLYGTAKAAGATVTTHYRVNSGSRTSLTVNGKTWSADTTYSFDNLEPYTNNAVTQIAGTDDDELYLVEQSSNGEKKPFRYEFPVANGNYIVRLHFAEIYWGVAGGGFSGGAGSRVMSVALENQLRLVNFDVTQEVGSATAVIKNLPVTVTDGKLNINFSAVANRPMVCAVEIVSFSSSAQARSITKEIVINEKISKSRVYPNPAENKIRIHFAEKFAGRTTVQILDAVGKTYPVGRLDLQKGGSTVEADISRLSLKSGVYFLRITAEDNTTEVVKLVVK